MKENTTIAFARWICLNYADTKMDKSLKTENEVGFNEKESLSLPNVAPGEWWKEKYNYYIQNIYKLNEDLQ